MLTGIKRIGNKAGRAIGRSYKRNSTEGANEIQARLDQGAKRMTKDEIKQNAPDGATHYSETDMEYIFLKESYKYGWKCFGRFGSWQPYIVEDSEEIKPL